MRTRFHRAIAMLFVAVLGASALLTPVSAAPGVEPDELMQTAQDRKQAAQDAKDARKTEANIRKANANAEKQWRKCVAQHGACQTFVAQWIAPSSCRVEFVYVNPDAEAYPVVYVQLIEYRDASGTLIDEISQYASVIVDGGQVANIATATIQQGWTATGQAYKTNEDTGETVQLGSYSFTC